MSVTGKDNFPKVISDMKPQDWLAAVIVAALTYLIYYLLVHPAIIGAYELEFWHPQSHTSQQKLEIVTKIPQNFSYFQSKSILINAINTSDTKIQKVLSVYVSLWVPEEAPQNRYPISVEKIDHQTADTGASFIRLDLPPKSAIGSTFSVTPDLPRIIREKLKNADIYTFEAYLLVQVRLGSEQGKVEGEGDSWVVWTGGISPACDAISKKYPKIDSMEIDKNFLCAKIDPYQSFRHSLIEFLLLPPWVNGFFGIMSIFVVAVTSTLFFPTKRKEDYFLRSDRNRLNRTLVIFTISAAWIIFIVGLLLLAFVFIDYEWIVYGVSALTVVLAVIAWHLPARSRNEDKKELSTLGHENSEELARRELLKVIKIVLIWLNIILLMLYLALISRPVYLAVVNLFIFPLVAPVAWRKISSYCPPPGNGGPGGGGGGQPPSSPPDNSGDQPPSLLPLTPLGGASGQSTSQSSILPPGQDTTKDVASKQNNPIDDAEIQEPAKLAVTSRTNFLAKLEEVKQTSDVIIRQGEIKPLLEHVLPRLFEVFDHVNRQDLSDEDLQKYQELGRSIIDTVKTRLTESGNPQNITGAISALLKIKEEPEPKVGVEKLTTLLKRALGKSQRNILANLKAKLSTIVPSAEPKLSVDQRKLVADEIENKLAEIKQKDIYSPELRSEFEKFRIEFARYKKYNS